mmetsp:Transcript_37693/g.91553  ORF Transcript_37693/g.91553 Transcript_37693/m.91553 type:complete len:106 (+) Transcript_37693:723-1040(+)
MSPLLSSCVASTTPEYQSNGTWLAFKLVKMMDIAKLYSIAHGNVGRRAAFCRSYWGSNEAQGLVLSTLLFVVSLSLISPSLGNSIDAANRLHITTTKRAITMPRE